MFLKKKMFHYFLLSRLSADISEVDQFEHYVLRNIANKFIHIRELYSSNFILLTACPGVQDAKELKKTMYVVKNKSWKKRYVTLSGSELNIFSSKRKMKDIKLSIQLRPGSYYVETAEDEAGNLFFFTLTPVDADDLIGQVQFRTDSKEVQKDWVDAMRSRLLDAEIRSTYRELTKKISRTLSTTGSTLNLGLSPQPSHESKE
jgi:hypothetical protein